MSTRANRRRSVLIAGAGPTGLTLAGCLAHYGVPFDLIEARPGPCRESKALALNVLNQGCFELTGRAGLLGRNGCQIRRLNTYWRGHRMNPVDFKYLGLDSARLITQPQFATESELVRGLEAHGVVINWHTSLLSLQEEPDQVTAVIKAPSGKSEARSYEYVVGCEGKHSIVRAQIGASFAGSDYDMHFVLGDFPLRGARPTDEVDYYVFDDTFVIIAPVSPTHFRIVVKRDGSGLGVPLRALEVTDVVDRYVEVGLISGEPAWLSKSQFYLRTADRLWRDRLLVAGDAAHLFSPIGGTGMNTGMQDAFNLGWRLAQAYHGHGGHRQLLAGYERERLEAIEATAQMTSASTFLIAHPTDPASESRKFLPHLHNRNLVRRVFPRGFSGLAPQYARSLRAQDLRSRPGALRAGEFCGPLVAVLRSVTHSESASRRAALRVLALLGSRPDPAEAQDLVTLDNQLTTAFGERVRLSTVHVTTRADSTPQRAQHAPTLEPGVAERWGLAAPLLLLIRPDGILAFAGELTHRAELIRYLTEFFADEALLGPQANLRTAEATEGDLHSLRC